MRRRVLVASEPMEYGVLAYLERLFDGLDRSRWEPALAFSPHRMAPQAYALLARLRAEGVRLRQLPLGRGVGLGDALSTVCLLEELREFRPDIVHLHSTKAGLVGRLAGALRRSAVLYTPHGTSWRYTGRVVGRIQLALERALRRATGMLVSVCPEEANAFVDEVGFDAARVRVIRNGVRLPDRAALGMMRRRARAALGMAPDEVWALFVGRLTHEKGADVLLRALRADAGVDGLVIVGAGAERRGLEAAAAQAPVSVRFCGYQEDVAGFLAAGDIFVQPSRSEGLPFAALEAMAHGLPLVCSDVGGLAGAVDGCGRLVEPDDPVALARTLRELARDAALRRALGAGGPMRVAEQFGLPAMMSALHRAYEEADGAGPRERRAA